MHIESRSSVRYPGRYEFMVECVPGCGDLGAAIESLKNSSEYFTIISRNHNNNRGSYINYYRYESILKFRNK